MSAAAGVLLPAILARSLDQTEYGTYKQLFLVSSLVLYTLQLGLGQSLFFFVPRASEPSERRAWLGQTQVMLVLLGIGATLGTWALAPWLAERFSNPRLAELTLPLGVLAGALVGGSALEVGLTARGRPVASASAMAGTELLRVAAMLVPIHLGYGLEGLAWGAAGAALSRVVLASALCFGPGALSSTRHQLARQLAYALPFGGAVLLAMPQQQLHQFFVSGHASPALFALYAVGCMQIPVVGLLYAPVSETMQVALGRLEAQGRTDEAGPVFTEAIGRLASVFLPLCAFLVATAGPGLRLLYGEPYAEAASIFRIAVASVAISSVPVDGLLKARGRTRTLLVANALKLAATWPVLAAGWRLFGLEGAIAGHVVVEAMHKTGLLTLAAREVRLRPSGLVTSGVRQGAARALVVGLAGTAGVWLGGGSAFWSCAWAALAGGGVVLAERFWRRRGAQEGRVRRAA